MSKSEPQHLGKNDAANGPFPYRTKPNLGEPENDRDYFPAGIPVVKADEIARNNGTRTGRSE